MNIRLVMSSQSAEDARYQISWREITLNSGIEYGIKIVVDFQTPVRSHKTASINVCMRLRSRTRCIRCCSKIPATQLKNGLDSTNCVTYDMSCTWCIVDIGVH